MMMKDCSQDKTWYSFIFAVAENYFHQRLQLVHVKNLGDPGGKNLGWDFS